MMKTFKQIYEEVEKALGETPEPELYAQRNDWANLAMEEWFRVCTLCHKKCKNYRGVIIHTAKVHRETYLLAKKTRAALQYGDAKVYTYWDLKHD